MNSVVGEGGGPRVRVRIRWISRIIFSLIAVMSLEDLVPEVASARNCKASSRSLVVINWLIAPDACALNESG